MEPEEQTPQIETVPLYQRKLAAIEQAKAVSQSVIDEVNRIAEENRLVLVPEPTLWEKLKEKADDLLNVKNSPMTSTVGVGAALVCYYEAFDYFLSDRAIQAWMKVGQGTFALAVGIISKDPQFFKPKQ